MKTSLLELRALLAIPLAVSPLACLGCAYEEVDGELVYDPDATGTGGSGGSETNSNATGGSGATGGVASSGGSGGVAGGGGTDTQGSGGTASSGSGGAGGAGGGATARCGDGNVDPGEDCDDAGESADCNGDCTLAECGDGVVNLSAGEECEPSESSTCGSDCIESYEVHLTNRFSFDGTGTEIVDTVGSGDGTLLSTTLMDTGRLVLAGGQSGEFVSLANGLASAHTNATFEAWLSWDGGKRWQRIFDFGSSDGGERIQDFGTTYLFLTPRADSDLVRVAFTDSGTANEIVLDATQAFPVGVETHVAVVVDDDNDLLSLYLDGALDASVAFSGHLADIDDFNTWIGLSQYSADPEFGGAIDEFRVYGAALSADQIADSFAAGPDF